MAKDYSKLTALIVDDDAVLRLVMTKELGSVGINSLTASNGTEAILSLKKSKFDFILMDISMPGQDGLDATRWIREMSETVNNGVPIFAVTSFSSEEHTKEILDAGFNEHFVKPFDLNKILESLDKYFWKLD
jgi:CheY-like chemotaxis protein